MPVNRCMVRCPADVGRFRRPEPFRHREKEETWDKPTGNNRMKDAQLCVRSVDLLSSQKSQNRKEHHTDLFHGDELIVRRGQPFQIQVELNRPFHADTDKLQLELEIGYRPLESKGTRVVIPLVDHLKDERWEAKLVEQRDNKLKLSVNSLASAVVGRYKLSVVTSSAKEKRPRLYKAPDNIVILFNPWCKEDAVFLDSEAERKEYVLNDTGRIYYGRAQQIGARTWNFGQFDEGMLEACLYLLEKSQMPPPGRGDPVNVVRVISAMINVQNDSGVLVGKWSGDYSDGVSPTAWCGSVEILKRYHSSYGTPVRYAQCWVYSGVTTTVLRCLGIPTRSVTNFQSAHDTDVSLTTDVYLDEDMKPLDHLSDSIWNFHVWNDCWMARPDLPPGYGGWQAVDSTPQETSQGIFRCGPASVNAIRSGHVYLKHDAAFVFAEVNSDKFYWQRNLDGTFRPISCETNVVGRFISTKAVGSDKREDITHLYKHREGSEEERIAVETASRFGSKPKLYLSPSVKDVTVEVKMIGEGPRIGEDAKFNIVVKNVSAKPRHATLYSQVAVMYYTGVVKGTIKKEEMSVNLQPNEEKIIEWVLLYQEYQDQLVEQAALMLTLSGRVTETQQVLANQTNFRFRTPDLNISLQGIAVAGMETTAKITFTNPLPRTLKDVVVRVEGLGLMKGHEMFIGDIGGLDTVTLTEHFYPTQPGPRKLVASLDCKQLSQVHGVADITVVQLCIGSVLSN